MESHFKRESYPLDQYEHINCDPRSSIQVKIQCSQTQIWARAMTWWDFFFGIPWISRRFLLKKIDESPPEFWRCRKPKNIWKTTKQSFPDSCVLAVAFLMPLARSSTLCWLLIRLASWATFFFWNFSLKLLKFGTMKLQGVVFSAWNRRVSVSFFWGVKFSGMNKNPTSWNKLMSGIRDA